jgi:hypothetical protein
MIFVTVDEVKFDLKIENDDEDEDVESRIDSAEALVRGYVRRPLTLEAFSRIIEAPKEIGYRALRQISLPIYPLASPGMSAGNYSADGDVEILDVDLDLVSPDDYRVERHTGIIYAASTFQWLDYPYSISWVAGLGARPDYETFVVPLLRKAIFDVVRDNYLRRNPVAQTESTGGGVATNYFNHGIPKQVQDALDLVKMKRLV